MAYWQSTYANSSDATTASSYCYDSTSNTSTGTLTWSNTGRDWTTYIIQPPTSPVYTSPVNASLAPLSKEEKRRIAEEARQAEVRRREAERLRLIKSEKVRVEQERVEKLAQRLLEETFGKEILNTYLKEGRVSLDSPSKPRTRYVIAPSGRIKVFENERLVDELCVHLFDPENGGNDDVWLPGADVVVGKALLVLHDEERLLRIANHNPVRA